jgi:NAD+---dinitrogen-reductase ADP-D-ribosyltransferase
MELMAVPFCLDHLEDPGPEPDRRRRQRVNANYPRRVRGWSFDSDGREGAVLKSWAEPRSGLLPRQHTGPLGDRDSKARHTYMRQAAVGISTV